MGHRIDASVGSAMGLAGGQTSPMPPEILERRGVPLLINRNEFTVEI